MLFKNAEIFTAEGKFVHGSFRVENGRFAEILATVPEEDGIDLEGALVIPGLVDVHIHGAMNADFSDGNEEGVRKMAAYLASQGVTSFTAASMTLPYEVLDKAYQVGDRIRKNRTAGCARLQGAQMEGPFFSEKKKGAQNAAYLRLPDAKAFAKLQADSDNMVKIVDVAAELEGAADFIQEASKSCTVAVGHTDAAYEDAKAAFEAGASHLVHLFNAMPSIHHRKPGTIGAASEREDVVAELICDGLHVHPSSVRMAFKLFPGRICLISDALRCCGMPDGEYELGGQPVFLKDSIARLADGTIAGSATNLFQCMRNAVRFGIPREQAILSATRIPAKEIGCDKEIGTIEPGKLADFVVCDQDLNRKAVYIGGEAVR